MKAQPLSVATGAYRIKHRGVGHSRDRSNNLVSIPTLEHSDRTCNDTDAQREDGRRRLPYFREAFPAQISSTSIYSADVSPERKYAATRTVECSAAQLVPLRLV